MEELTARRGHSRPRREAVSAALQQRSFVENEREQAVELRKRQSLTITPCNALLGWVQVITQSSMIVRRVMSSSPQPPQFQLICRKQKSEEGQMSR